MAAVTICSDFGAPKNKVSHCFHCFPIYFPWSDGTRCHDLSFHSPLTLSSRGFLVPLHLMHSSVYISIRISQFILSPPPWYPYLCSLYLCLYFCFADKFICTFFCIPHISNIIFYLFFSSDLLHYVWHSLGPSMSLQVARVCYLLWLRNIPLRICTSLSVSWLMNTKIASMS